MVKEVYSCIINMFKSTLLKSLPYRIDLRQFFKQEALSIQDPWGGGGGMGETVCTIVRSLIKC